MAPRVKVTVNASSVPPTTNGTPTASDGCADSPPGRRLGGGRAVVLATRRGHQLVSAWLRQIGATHNQAVRRDPTRQQCTQLQSQRNPCRRQRGPGPDFDPVQRHRQYRSAIHMQAAQHDRHTQGRLRLHPGPEIIRTAPALQQEQVGADRDAKANQEQEQPTLPTHPAAILRANPIRAASSSALQCGALAPRPADDVPI